MAAADLISNRSFFIHQPCCQVAGPSYRNSGCSAFHCSEANCNAITETKEILDLTPLTTSETYQGKIERWQRDRVRFKA